MFASEHNYSGETDYFTLNGSMHFAPYYYFDLFLSCLTDSHCLYLETLEIPQNFQQFFYTPIHTQISSSPGRAPNCQKLENLYV